MADKQKRIRLSAGSPPVSPPSKKARPEFLTAPAMKETGTDLTTTQSKYSDDRDPFSTYPRVTTIPWPAADKMWEVFGDLPTEIMIKTTTDVIQYTKLVRGFHARLALIVRGLHLEEVLAVFRACLPAWYATASKADQVTAQEEFEGAFDWVQDELVKKMKFYALQWYTTDAGTQYRNKWKECKRRRNYKAYPKPAGPQSSDDMLKFNDLDGLLWEQATSIDFWLVGLAAIETENVGSAREIGWIKSDSDRRWYLDLTRIALDLIAGYAAAIVDIPSGVLSSNSVRDILRAVPITAQASQNDMKSKLVLRKQEAELSLVGLHPWDPNHWSLGMLSSGNDSDTDQPFEVTEAGVRARQEFPRATAAKTNEYQAAGDKLEAAFTRGLASDLGRMASQSEFVPRGYPLNFFTPPPLSTQASEHLGLQYAALPFYAANEFHKHRFQLELDRLEALISSGCERLEAGRKELAYIKSMEEKRAKQISILQSLAKETKVINKEIEVRKAAANEPVSTVTGPMPLNTPATTTSDRHSETPQEGKELDDEQQRLADEFYEASGFS